MRKGNRILAGLAAVLMACGGTTPAQSPQPEQGLCPAFVQVENQSYADFNVFVFRNETTRQRLGRSTANTTQAFKIPADLLTASRGSSSAPIRSGSQVIGITREIHGGAGGHGRPGHPPGLSTEEEHMRSLVSASSRWPSWPASPRAASSRAPVDPMAPAYVEVQNQSFYDMTVYVIRSGQRVRLGQVSGNSTATFELPRTMVNPGTADPVPGRSDRRQQDAVQSGDRGESGGYRRVDDTAEVEFGFRVPMLVRWNRVRSACPGAVCEGARTFTNHNCTQHRHRSSELEPCSSAPSRDRACVQREATRPPRPSRPSQRSPSSTAPSARPGTRSR